MKILNKALIFSGIGVIAYSLYRYYKIQLNFLENIEYKIVGIKIVDFKKDLITIDVTSTIYNTSNVDATIKEIYLDFFINDVVVGNITEAKDLLIKSNESTNVTLRVSINPKLVLGNVVNLLSFTLASKDMTFKAKGFVKLKSGFINAALPFEYVNNFNTLLKK